MDEAPGAQAPRTGPLSEDQIAAIIGKQIADARLYYNSDREGYRDKAIRYFEGECPDIPARPHRSQVVSRDVADVHGMIMPSLMRVFFSSDRVAIYEPTRQEQEQFADQATDYVNYVVLKECDGYRYFRDAFSDGLLLGNGIVKHYWDPTPEYSIEDYTGLSEGTYKLLLTDPQVEVVTESSKPDPNYIPPAMPSPGGQSPLGGLSSLIASIAGSQPAPGGPDATGQSPQPMPPQMGSMGPVGAPGATPPAISPGGVGSAPPEAGPEDSDAPQTELSAGPMLWDCTVKRKTSNGRLKLVAIPYEEFLIERGSRVLDEENCRFCAHVRLRTRSSLIEEGYDPDKVEAMPSFSDVETWQNRELRDPKVMFNQEGPDRSTDLVEVHECYVLLDSDGDGIAERMRIVMGGIQGQRNVLLFEPWGDDLPFSDITPDPRPYAWRGYGLYDLLADIQKMKSVVQRGVMDNTYWALNPQRAADLTQIRNIDELLNPSFGGIVDAPSGTVIASLEVPFIVDKLSPVLDYLDSIAQRRTGISPQSQALDLDVLQNQSATAVNASMSAAFSKVEEYARNIAECGGLKRVFKCILKLIVKHQDRPKMIQLRGEWVDMDPRAWDADMNVTVNTGLGAGSRDRDMQMLSNILSIQQQAIQIGGPNNPLAGLDKLSNTCIKLVETAGVKSPDSYFNPITAEQMQKIASQPPPPDPKMIEAQSKSQAEQMRLQIEQMKAQKDMAVQQSESQSNQARIMAEIEKARSEAQTKLIEANARMREIDLKQQLAAAQIQLDMMKAKTDTQTTLTKTAIDNLIKLEIARINASKDTDTRPNVVEERIGHDAGITWPAQHGQI